MGSRSGRSCTTVWPAFVKRSPSSARLLNTFRPSFRSSSRSLRTLISGKFARLCSPVSIYTQGNAKQETVKHLAPATRLQRGVGQVRALQHEDHSLARCTRSGTMLDGRMSSLLEVFVTDTGRAAPRSRHGGVLRLCFCTVWYCVVALCGPTVWRNCVARRCGPTVWSNCVVRRCVIRLYGTMVQHARALAGPVAAVDGTTTFWSGPEKNGCCSRNNVIAWCWSQQQQQLHQQQRHHNHNQQKEEEEEEEE